VGLRVGEGGGNVGHEAHDKRTASP
jgi:hypothetical protein